MKIIWHWLWMWQQHQKLKNPEEDIQGRIEHIREVEKNLILTSR